MRENLPAPDPAAADLRGFRAKTVVAPSLLLEWCLVAVNPTTPSPNESQARQQQARSVQRSLPARRALGIDRSAAVLAQSLAFRFPFGRHGGARFHLARHLIFFSFPFDPSGGFG